MQIIDSNLQNFVWTRETGPDINKIPATNYTAKNVPLGPSGNALLVTNYSAQDGGADLVTTKRPNYATLFPSYNLNYLRLRMKMFISSIDKLNLGRLETDVKVCMVKSPTSVPPGIPNVANGSTESNFTNGFWQIDGNPPGWLNTTYKPTIPVDTWFDYYHDIKIDPVAKTFSVLGCRFGNQAYLTPAGMLNVPWQTTQWQGLVAAVQLQLMVFKAGTVNVAYDVIDLVWSDSLG